MSARVVIKDILLVSVQKEVGPGMSIVKVMKYFCF